MVWVGRDYLIPTPSMDIDQREKLKITPALMNTIIRNFRPNRTKFDTMIWNCSHSLKVQDANPQAGVGSASGMRPPLSNASSCPWDHKYQQEFGCAVHAFHSSIT